MLLAGRGADKLYGGAGADRLLPGDDSQVDVLRGGPGPDRIFARTGRGLGPDEPFRMVSTYGCEHVVRPRVAS